MTSGGHGAVQGSGRSENDHQEATPKAPPILRAVWFTALPTAKRSGWSEETAAAAKHREGKPDPEPTQQGGR